MHKYTIYTEQDENLEVLAKRAGLRNFTIIAGLGCWQGGREDSAVIEVICDSTEKAAVQREIAEFGRLACTVNSQEEVMVTSQYIEAYAIHPEGVVTYEEPVKGIPDVAIDEKMYLCQEIFWVGGDSYSCPIIVKAFDAGRAYMKLMKHAEDSYPDSRYIGGNYELEDGRLIEYKVLGEYRAITDACTVIE